jgi:cobalamin biosynthesis Mg chelatase CobN
VEGYEMQPETDVNSNNDGGGSSPFASSGAAILGTLMVLLTLSVVYLGFRRKE